jgi:predicted alpha/beta hydrolase
MPETQLASLAERIDFPALDGYRLSGHYWPGPPTARAAVLINAATGVAARYYHRYAAWLSAQGMRVLVWDYRGIGLSRPARLRKLRATKQDWGALDCEGALQELARRAPDLPLFAVCHSIGGFALGLAPSLARVRRALFVGCQYAYWRDYHPAHRLAYFARWHLLMPVLAGLLGYFPGRRLGWLEDLPRGVALEWALRHHPSFHRFYACLPHARPPAPGDVLEANMARFTGDILALADRDDEYATPAASRRLLAYFRHGTRHFVPLDRPSPELPRIGHFGFFHDRYRDSLWQASWRWLSDGELPWPPLFSLFPETTPEDGAAR